jgi:hypothetical protein
MERRPWVPATGFGEPLQEERMRLELEALAAKRNPGRFIQ